MMKLYKTSIYLVHDQEDEFIAASSHMCSSSTGSIHHFFFPPEDKRQVKWMQCTTDAQIEFELKEIELANSGIMHRNISPSAASQRQRRNILVGLCVAVLIFIGYYNGRGATTPCAQGNTRTASSADHLTLPPADPKYASTTTLILVPGHGVYRGINPEKDWASEDAWGLEPFQRGFDGFLIRAFSQHIKRGLEQLKELGTSDAIVVFSGGQTKDFGPRSEGLSYYLVAEANRLFGVFPEHEQSDVLQHRIFAEEFARDSYENLLFSICRFREVVGVFPRNIVVVNWAYKRQRFEEYHRVAVRWHKSNFQYIGIDMKDAAEALGLRVPPQMRALSDAGTLKRVQEDLYLCKVNMQTRLERNPQRRVIPYLLSCPEISGLLTHCGPELYDERNLPWGGPL